jgi:hypothetical protein
MPWPRMWVSYRLCGVGGGVMWCGQRVLKMSPRERQASVLFLTTLLLSLAFMGQMLVLKDAIRMASRDIVVSEVKLLDLTYSLKVRIISSSSSSSSAAAAAASASG